MLTKSDKYFIINNKCLTNNTLENENATKKTHQKIIAA